jgi:hypothetical protein
MDVPFERLGPGQVARLAVQVLGKDGPVVNPAGIRYLPPDAVEGFANVGGISDMAGALAGVNVLLSAGNLALTAATLAEVKRISGKLDHMLDEQQKASRKLEDVIAKMERVQGRVSEGRLADWVKHALRKAAKSDRELSFLPFSDLASDLEVFTEEARLRPGAPLSLRLGSDTREGLLEAFRILRSARLTVAAAVNATASAEKVWRCGSVEDYWSKDGGAVFADIGAMEAIQAWDLASFAAHATVAERFTFDDNEDHHAIQDAMDTAAIGAIWVDAGVAEDEVLPALKKMRDEAAKATGVSLSSDESVWLSKEFTDAYAERVRARTRELYRPGGNDAFTFPVEVLNAQYEAGDKEDVLSEYREWWLYGTDAGLVYRVYVECAAVRDGYSDAFADCPEQGGTAPRQATAVCDFSSVR